MMPVPGSARPPKPTFHEAMTRYNRELMEWNRSNQVGRARACRQAHHGRVSTLTTNAKGKAMYQPTLGRFLSRDPISANGVDVLTDTGFYSDRLAAMNANPWYYGGNWDNPYVYARNNPLRYTDPSGLRAASMELPPSGGYPPSRTPAEDCACWVRTQQNQGTGWLAKLPACPCSIGKPPKNPNPSIWHDPEGASPYYHPAQNVH